MKSALRELYDRYQAAGEFPSRLQIKRDMEALLAQEQVQRFVDKDHNRMRDCLISHIETRLYPFGTTMRGHPAAKKECTAIANMAIQIIKSFKCSSSTPATRGRIKQEREK
jgi:hypothetical protein